MRRRLPPSQRATASRPNNRETEFHVLVLLAALGTVVMADAADLMLLAAGYLLASIPLYALASFAKDPAGTEASLKFYLLGALLGVTTLIGVTLLFGVGGPPGTWTCGWPRHRRPRWPWGPSRCSPVCCSRSARYSPTSGYRT
ncbi:hypothetical protein SK854_13910 [Lentzea sp. BCCO 10_0061]|uniref:NADH:quinone oxidoreductase/Mrp antiporter membrane subunit domain-containing protein n=1 Tax=Lentzea sokolovensis TaxID=3095429 RepID=A0ABU4UUN1_9PSEU|nr:hypothetical protein [Lentzea sp. BCCO 10_0061]MDX8143218.1 hypothetical protein [Lentzea sp. BCCO 10_0061]